MKKFYTNSKFNTESMRWFYYNNSLCESSHMEYYEYFNNYDEPLELFQSYLYDQKIVMLFFNLIK